MATTRWPEEIAPPSAAPMVRALLPKMRIRAAKLSAILAAAEACAEADDVAHAIQIALDVEPLLYEMTTLLNAASLIVRLEREGE